jgi:hypothetical protein
MADRQEGEYPACAAEAVAGVEGREIIPAVSWLRSAALLHLVIWGAS